MLLGKKRQLKLLILVFQNQNSLFRQKKTSIDFKDTIDKKGNII